MVHRADRRQRSEDRGDEVGIGNAEVGRKKEGPTAYDSRGTAKERGGFLLNNEKVCATVSST
jgi:hypothetical protein